MLAVGALPANLTASSDDIVMVAAASVAEARTALDDAADYDAIVIDGQLAGSDPVGVEAMAGRAAFIVVVPDPSAEHAVAWLRRGAQDVISGEPGEGRRRIRFAVERRRWAQTRDPAYSTDVSTGLPHRQQFVEHLSQLLALREREPSPMAVVALRVVKTADAAALNEADMQAVRRKVAVRLRAGVRASDVVASLGEDSFAVLLGSLLAAPDAERVAAKLVALAVAPFVVGGQPVALAVATGISQFPRDGAMADKLLRRAVALANAAPPVDGGPPHGHDAQGNTRAAANDDA